MEYNDYELVSLAKEGNEEANNLLYQKYKPIVVSKSKDAIVYASHHGIEINDIMQEGYIGLEEAIKNFDEDDNTTFYTFAVLCINRQIINYLRKCTRGKNRILNDAISIDETVEKNFKDDFDIEMNFISKDIMNDLTDKLTEFEYSVLKFRLDGYSYEEIAKHLNKNIKAIYNTFQRIKDKVKKIIDWDNYFRKYYKWDIYI